MSNELILADRIGKKFHRTLMGACMDGAKALARKSLRLKPRDALGKDEFWALQEVSFLVRRGECLGVIGPNGAGKSTLLKLIHREFRPDAGRLVSRGRMTSLIRIGEGLQPLLSGRENIYVQCQQRGLDKRGTDGRLEQIVAFAGLEEAIDAPVKTYSDGMYARLEFAIATSVQPDILLVDEVLAVGDIAFQIRALDRLNQLKREGAAIVFVSHSEMNVRHVADACLLLCNGRQVALGGPDALFYQYYQSVGYLDQRLQALGAAMPMPQDMAGELAVKGLRPWPGGGDGFGVRTGESLDLAVEYEANRDGAAANLILHFWSAAGMLVASVDSGLGGAPLRLLAGRGAVRVRLPFFSLTPGVYRISAGFIAEGQWLAYAGNLVDLPVAGGRMRNYAGLTMLEAEFEPVRLS